MSFFLCFSLDLNLILPNIVLLYIYPDQMTRFSVMALFICVPLAYSSLNFLSK